MSRLAACIAITGSGLATLASSALAQQPPGAGQAIQELRPPLTAPVERPGMQVTPAESAPVPPGGPQVTLRSISFTGNTRFSDARLLAVLGDVIGRSYDLAGLRALADRLTDYYREWQSPFARVVVPAQPMTDGHLRLQVVEGRYGSVRATGDPALAAPAQKFLGGLRTGDPIETVPLERASMVMADLPGYRVTPIVRPGQEVGAGDLSVFVERTDRYSGDVGLDNHGNRYTGRYRARTNLFGNSALLFGDQVSFRGIYTDEQLWYGSLVYAAPIGGSGLRGNVSLARTSYELGKEFASLGATGTADVASAGLSYPLWRSQRASAVLSASYVEKRLQDRRSVAGTYDDRHSRTTPVALNFDVRDQWMGGGLTYGALTGTYGSLDVGPSLSATDAATARTAGNFKKLNFDMVRLQSLGGRFTLFTRLSTQFASDNLDSSERFGLGGINGVRAYPSGEGFGDEGWLAQVELHTSYGPYSPYLFHDAGAVKINHTQWVAGNNRRAVQGSGVGVRYTRGQWNADLVAAWRTEGGDPQSDSKKDRPMLWFSLGWRF